MRGTVAVHRYRSLRPGPDRRFDGEDGFAGLRPDRFRVRSSPSEPAFWRRRVYHVGNYLRKGVVTVEFGVF